MDRPLPFAAHLRVETAEADHLIGLLCDAVERKTEARGDVRARVTRSQTEGRVDLGWGRCTMRAADGILDVQLEASDEAGLAQLEELTTRHLEHHDPGSAGSSEDANERRARMRAFHLRMRRPSADG